MAATPSHSHIEKGKSLFIFGLGYVGSEVAKQAALQHYKVSGTVQRGVPLKKKVYHFDEGIPLSDEGIRDLRESTHVLSTIPPNGDGSDPVLKNYKDQLSHKNWVGYCSSTGVYGKYEGETVNESSKTAKGGIDKMSSVTRRRHIVDSKYQTAGISSPLVIFRIAGIYGPGRSTLTQLHHGKVRHITKPNHVISRVHRDDIVQGILKSMSMPPKSGDIKIYNVSDDEPASQSSVINYAAALLNMTTPLSIPFQMIKSPSDRLRSFYESCRRIDNSTLKSELGWVPKYPNYKIGLAACLEHDRKQRLRQEN